MAIQKNSFVLIDYVMRSKDTGELIDTTVEDIAKKENKWEADKIYEPLLIIVGENRIIRGLEEHVENFAEAGKEYEIEIPPEKAYGMRDPSKVKILSIRELLRNNVVPEVGKTVEVGGQVGVVKAITGGRVLIDFNHPLAGKTFVCRYKVVKILDDDAEKIKYLLHRRYRRIPIDRFKVFIDQNSNSVTIEMPKEILLDRDLQLVKAIVAEEIYKYIGKYDTVTYIERFERMSK
ncbi:MAG: peptidylprolyl isomerase [Ignisphaera sp.]|jgi:peptidylprolyl isomerase|nr:peptidylprolyl isomerase [Ignisphaera sp.]